VILFLLKGLARDRSRSLFPLLTVVAGVTLTVVGQAWVRGTESGLVHASASFSTGHVKVAPRGAAAESDAASAELALDQAGALLGGLRRLHPELGWTPRIRFGGLLDVPDADGETKVQAPVAGLAIDLLSPGSLEPGILNVGRAIVKGRMPRAAPEVLVSDQLFERLGLRLGDAATLISTTRFGSVATANLLVVGTVRFGVSAIDRGALVADVTAIQRALDMDDAVSEVLGFFPDRIYRDTDARAVARTFNGDAASRAAPPDPDLAPVMIPLRDDPGLATILDLTTALTGVQIAIFVFVMSIVLWNAGLMGSLRRYGEIGIRLAVGERKGHVYGTLVAESLMIGVAGSVIGTALGVAAAYYLQVQGIDISPYLKNASLLIADVLRAKVTAGSFVVGFVPGVLSTLLGSAISGAGIYRRQTARLMKEFEA
jgi:putative ABC transport system permease protein